MTPAPCTIASHEATKRDELAWSALRFIGIQRDEEGDDLELRNCTCGSTLCRAISRASEAA